MMTFQWNEEDPGNPKPNISADVITAILLAALIMVGMAFARACS
jgi:hypothetical protein